MQADGSFVLTPDSWVIKGSSFIDLGMEVRLPAQTAARKEVIGEISFTLDWANTDGSEEDGRHDIGFIPGENGSIDDTTPVKTDENGVVPELPGVTPDAGYVFDHWEDQNGNPVKPGDKLEEDATLKPIFREDDTQPEDNSHTIDFTPGEHGAIDDDTPIKTDKDGVVPELPGVTPDAGYVFDHWEDQDGNPVKSGDTLKKDTVLKPVFAEKDNIHTINFVDGDQGTVPDKSELQTDKNGMVPTLPDTAPNRGYTFDHWEDENGATVNPGDLLNADVTLKPVFIKDGSYTISFAPGEHGAAKDAAPLRTNTDGIVPELPEVTLDDGFEFDHWEDESGTVIESGQVIYN